MIRLPEDVTDKLKQRALSEHRTQAGLITHIVLTELKN